MARPRIYWDLETFPNFFLFGYITDDPAFPGWKAYITPDKPRFTPDELQHIYQLAATCTWYSFNGKNYDEPMFRLALAGADNAMLKQLNDTIIPGKDSITGQPRDGIKPWEISRAGWPQADIPGFDHVDIMEVVPGVRIGLKTYMARGHSKLLQDLPYPPSTALTHEQMRNVWDYHNNDMIGTRELVEVCKARSALRERLSERYGTDMRSKSDAQMSEAIISARLGYRPPVPYIPSGHRFKLTPAPWLQFATPYMQDIYRQCCDVTFEWNRKDPGESLPDGTKTGVSMPAELKKLKVQIGNTVYKFGIGGLHSQETGRVLRSSPALQYRDSDVASYYPRLVSRMHLLDPAQQAIYDELADERVAMKRLAKTLPEGSPERLEAETAADGGKIVCNGFYGKLWSKYSFGCNPSAGVAVTINGQLSLLMLIERLELGGVCVVSANTDGIVTACPAGIEWYRDHVMQWWQDATGFELEHKDYQIVAQRDINSYCALDSDGDVKRKGVFAKSGILAGMQGGHPDRDISKDAAVDFLLFGKGIAATVHACTDIRKFVMTRKVAGGAYHAERFLGPTARWYYGLNRTEPLRNAKGNKVASSDGAAPIQVLPDTMPVDVDYEKYIEYARELVAACGYSM